MSNFTREQVKKLADNLMIGLTEEETEMVFAEFETIDKNINKITNIPDILDIEPMTHTLDDFSYSLREDIVKDSISKEDLLKNCDETDDGEVSIPKVVG